LPLTLSPFALSMRKLCRIEMRECERLIDL
jgi:hypothetical protein